MTKFSAEQALRTDPALGASPHRSPNLKLRILVTRVSSRDQFIVFWARVVQSPDWIRRGG